MPELPEVETIRQDLKKILLHKKINKIIINNKKIIKSNFKSFRKILLNNQIQDIRRRGKLIIFVLQDKKHYLLVHLRMTGQLIYQKNNSQIAGGHEQGEINNLPNKHTHVIIFFSNQAKLFFNDIRQFGIMKIVEQKQLNLILEKFGLEPLTTNFIFKDFYKIFKTRKKTVKTILLDQQLIAGIGNIYADEICFSANIKPNRFCNSLTKLEIKKIFLACNNILKKAIKYRGTTFSNYVDSRGKKGNYSKLLKVYQRDGKQCLKCSSGIIVRIKSNGRGTHYCPVCQK